ncbi:CHAT domain-containing protein [Streptomyces niveiscabiei]|uniref:CHAT domain-containing protein n=1 Tax=Streptomyces niveiscabiei TaxID=164115 RepID=UPI0006EB7804|nr:CHAT domain-containing protein [Streptomyces niveiscabiei]
MTRQLAFDMLGDSSGGFARPPVRHAGPPELRVYLHRNGPDGLRVRAHFPDPADPDADPWHRADLEIPAEKLLDHGKRLRTIWYDKVVRHESTEPGPGQRVGGHPFADSADLTRLGAATDALIRTLAEEGFDVLDVMLDGNGYDLCRFREFLLGALAGDRTLRISFESEWQLPWPMLAVDPALCASPWEAFLGHRHQVEQTDRGYPWNHAPLGLREKATTSLNKDDTLDKVGRAQEVHELLDQRSWLVVRSESRQLLEALSQSVLHEDVMYFWCHGSFVNAGAASQFLTIRLSDTDSIDGTLVSRKRRSYVRNPAARFRPFVLLNACHSAETADAGHLEHLGQKLIDLGATGILAPQIEMPQLFATEYAYAFLDQYLMGRHAAGEIGQSLVRRFAREFHNPLALAYSLNCGINSRLDLAS